ncbi:MAG: exodeoxyribonuclease VII small subunit [Tissierellia bacterium]|nr:exodeoxyribonuclease VII small subunit [Tissierellia bacterium]
MEIKLKDYEKNLNRLVEIVNRLDSNNISLEESIKLYDEGTKLYKGLRSVLEEERGKLKVYEDDKFKDIGGLDID